MNLTSEREIAEHFGVSEQVVRDIVLSEMMRGRNYEWAIVLTKIEMSFRENKQ